MMEYKPRKKGAVKGLLVFLFFIAAVAFILGKTEPLVAFSKVIPNINETASGQVTEFNGGLWGQLAGITVAGLAAAGATLIITRGDAVSSLLVGIIAFMVSNILPVPIAIFNDPQMPFEIKLLLITPIGILLAFGILEIFSGRKT